MAQGEKQRHERTHHTEIHTYYDGPLDKRRQGVCQDRGETRTAARSLTTSTLACVSRCASVCSFYCKHISNFDNSLAARHGNFVRCNEYVQLQLQFKGVTMRPKPFLERSLNQNHNGICVAYCQSVGPVIQRLVVQVLVQKHLHLCQDVIVLQTYFNFDNSLASQHDNFVRCNEYIQLQLQFNGVTMRPKPFLEQSLH